jgi:hypothetical protein
MPNTLTNIMPKILARGLMALREQAIFPRLVNGDYSSEAAKKGTTIDVPIPSAVVATDVTPSNTPPAPDSSSPSVVQIPLNNWKKANFFLTDKEQAEIDRNAHFLPLQAGEAIRAIANKVNESVGAEYKGVFGYVGTAGTTPFATTVNAATDARKMLNQQLCPRDNRRAVVNYDAEANMLALAQFSDAEKVGSSQVKIEGEIGRKYGIDWNTDDAVPTHTSTPLTAGAATVNGAHAAGVKTVSIAKATTASPLVVGDILTFAGDSQTYTVTAAVTLAVGNTNVSFEPGLKLAKAGGEAVALKASHVANLVFHRDAFAFANRPLADSDMGLGGTKILSMQDPVTGISLRLEVSRQHKQTVWEFDLLWGVKLVRPEYATRLAG